MVTGRQIVAKAMTQKGKKYIYGFEVDLTDSNPEAFDCSELIQWVCRQLGIVPWMPDGAIYQWRFCRNRGLNISIQKAIKIPGALLFRITQAGNHVAISRGDGMTIEARGKAYGVGCWSATKGRGWTSAALIPGVKYETL